MDAIPIWPVAPDGEEPVQRLPPAHLPAVTARAEVVDRRRSFYGGLRVKLGWNRGGDEWGKWDCDELDKWGKTCLILEHHPQVEGGKAAEHEDEREVDHLREDQ